MSKQLTRYLVLMTVLALIFSLLMVNTFAADTACNGGSLGTFNGTPACVNENELHICKNNFPDANFRGFIAEKFNTNSTEYISLDSIVAIDFINCSNLEIADLTGIQYFTSLEFLACSENELASLDISNNAELEYLDCGGNNLTVLDLNSNTQLTQLFCDSNQLTTLELSHLDKSDVEVIDCSSNKLTSLTLPRVYLPNLFCDQNRLAYLDWHSAELLTCGNQCITRNLDIQITDIGYSIDMAQLLNEDQLARISAVTGGTYDEATQCISFSVFPEVFTYSLAYEHGGVLIGGNKQTTEMDVTVNVDCSHDWSPATISAPKTCMICGTTEGDSLELGKIENLTNSETNDYNAQISDSIENLTDKLFSEPELAQLELGNDISFRLTAADISSTLSSDAKSIIAEALGDYSVGIYLDISLFKQIGNRGLEPVVKTNGTITISLTVPSELQSNDRTYKIIRLHNGSTSILETVYDETSGTLYFETDSFSTYALIYSDPIDFPDDTDQPIKVPNDTDKPVETPDDTDNPDTSDSSDLRLYILITGFCVCTFTAATIPYIRRKVSLYTK